MTLPTAIRPRRAADVGVGDNPLYLIGGRQEIQRPLRAGGGHWYRYDRALILAFDPRAGALEKQLEYVSPPEACAVEYPPILFKQGAVEGDRLYVCTTTEVMVFRLPDFQRLNYVSLPSFNDLHHVRPTPDGTLLVVNTGLEMVLEIDPTGDVRRAWDARVGGEWSGSWPEGDLRRAGSLKPYTAHVNHVFMLGEDIWATRLLQRDAICLTRPGLRIEIGLEGVHDGFQRGDELFFTTVDGRLVIVDGSTLQVRDVIDLQELEGPRTMLGWCRGIHVEGRRAWVGFSRLRPTRWREYVTWVGRGFRNVLGSHVACYDLVDRRLLRRIDLEPAGLNGIFSILPAPALAVPAPDA